MSIDTVKRLLDITTPHYEEINLVWHGGEPLIMGIEFFKEVVALEHQYKCTIKNSIQSNLTLLTPEMASFFAANEIRVSGSYDGVTNDITRGNSKQILKGRQMMLNCGKRCGFIMVASGANIDYLIDSYQYFKTLGINYSLNIYLDQKGSSKQTLCLNKDTAILRLNELFDFWAHDVDGKIRISYFSNILDFILKKEKSVCTYTSCLGRWIAVRNNGDIVPCNRYFPPEYGFGNVYDLDDIGEAFESEGFKHLISQAIIRREKCKDCRIFPFCSGGCNNVAMNENGIENNGGLSCQVLIGVYEHIESSIARIKTEQNHESLNPILIKMLKL